MKKYWMVCLLAMVVMMLVMMPLAMAKAVDAVPAEGAAPDLTQLITKEALGTIAGMILVTAALTQGIKVLVLRNAEVHTIRLVAFIVAATVITIAKLIFSMPFEIADIVIMPVNALIVWWSAMKGYEQTVGLASTPAGNVPNKNLH